MPLRSTTTFAAFVAAAVLMATIAVGRAEVVVGAGHSVMLMTLSSIDQQCHASGRVTINVLENPRGGFLKIGQTLAYPNFNALNTRSRCNTRKLPATRVDYQSSGTFLGLDTVTIEAIYPEGGVKRIRVAISVRPIGPDTPGVKDSAPAPPPNRAESSLAPEGPLSREDGIPVRRPQKRRVRAKAPTIAATHHCRGACAADKAVRPMPPKPAQPNALITPI